MSHSSFSQVQGNPFRFAHFDTSARVSNDLAQYHELAISWLETVFPLTDRGVRQGTFFGAVSDAATSAWSVKVGLLDVGGGSLFALPQ